MTRASRLLIAGLLVSACLGAAPPATGDDRDLATLLRELDVGVIVRGQARRPPLASMLARDVEARLRMANRADAEAWQKLETKADWERFRNERLKALRKSLGEFPPVPRELKVRVTRTHH